MAMMMRLEDHLRKKKLVDESFNQIVAEKIQGSTTIKCFDFEQGRTRRAWQGPSPSSDQEEEGG
ncbi:hypothetical protein Pyn_24134 [Prunus yedoensis var. nudiflora]|uniref:Uncharacterized protein n=1 Tax=Prunus yedoensis var. nudiflora TaxID=2094558 RepID=A0A314ZVB0_PRUYE|nr:hypothetical protein Pyn_24134 [Prunus yedoensis var. nudiflora]